MKGKIIGSTLLWLGLVALSLVWNLYSAWKEQETIALQTARSFFDQVLITRRWNAGHGGVYVPVSSKVAPNPYLEDPVRDIPINETLTLTKVNPAFMTRQIAEYAMVENGIHFHITSLNPIRPENKASSREEAALRAFESGATEVGYLLPDKESESFFYMAPLYTEENCLQCHAKQGYRQGEIRGGISVTLPYVIEIPYVSLLAGHLLIGMAGLALILNFGIKLHRAYSRILHQAVIDDLTEIPNRRSFSETIMGELDRCQREKFPLVVILCDLDKFKDYNDTYGHARGDDCLVEVAQVLKSSLLRSTDFCARYGGEEFVFILPNTTKRGGSQVAERIRRKIEALQLAHETSRPLGVVTMSFGVSIREVDAHISHEQLIQQADEALYLAKANGRNRVEIFDEKESV